MGKQTSDRGNYKFSDVDHHERHRGVSDVDGGQQQHLGNQDGSLAVERDGGRCVRLSKPDRNERGKNDGADCTVAMQGQVDCLNYSIDRIEEVLYKSEPKWHLREVASVLMDDAWSDGTYPAYDDLNTIGKVFRAGPEKMSMRFPEVGPEIWEWLHKELEAVCQRRIAEPAST